MEFLLFTGDKNSLSQVEISAQIPSALPISESQHIFESDSLDTAIKMVSRLGSSIKLAVKTDISSLDPKVLLSIIDTPTFSICSLPPAEIDKALCHQIKDISETSLRFIEPKNEFGVTPVIFTKEKITEIFLNREKHSVYKTIWTHDFDHWIKKDRELPYANAHAGILPPKIARSMVNLVPFKDGGTLLDPFCGSGRILVEAAELGYKIVGNDISIDQTRDTEANLKALGFSAQMYTEDATHISTHINQPIDLIVTEPYMGKTNLRPDRAKYVVTGLKKLYLGCLKDWAKFLKTGSSVVMIFPVLSDNIRDYVTSSIVDDPHLLGYNITTRGLLYFRPGARVKREIVVLQRN